MERCALKFGHDSLEKMSVFDAFAWDFVRDDTRTSGMGGIQMFLFVSGGCSFVKDVVLSIKT